MREIDLMGCQKSANAAIIISAKILIIYTAPTNFSAYFYLITGNTLMLHSLLYVNFYVMTLEMKEILHNLKLQCRNIRACLIFPLVAHSKSGIQKILKKPCSLNQMFTFTSRKVRVSYELAYLFMYNVLRCQF